MIVPPYMSAKSEIFVLSICCKGCNYSLPYSKSDPEITLPSNPTLSLKLYQHEEDSLALTVYSVYTLNISRVHL